MSTTLERPNAERARQAITCLWIVLAICALQVISSGMQLQLLHEFQLTDDVEEERWTNNDLREQWISYAYLTAYIVSGIVFIRWFRRAYFNLKVRYGTTLFSEGWAAGAWFVPFISLYRPLQIFQEMFRGTGNALDRRGMTYQRVDRPAIGIWWVLWLISDIGSQIALRLSLKAETVDEYVTITILDLVTHSPARCSLSCS